MNHMTKKQDGLPLTLGQLDFWEEFQAHPGQSVSTVAHVTRLIGAVDQPALARAIEATMAEADVLSLRFRAGDPPVQCVDPASRPALEFHDLRDHANAEAAAQTLMRADIDRPLDLCNDRLTATWLMRTADDCWLWYLRGHHIFLDGYSMALIERRVAQLYAHFAHETPPGQPFARFADYLTEETDYRASPRHTAARDFWRDQLATGAGPETLRKGSEDYPATPLSSEIALSHLAQDLAEMAARTRMGWPDLLIALAALWLNQCPVDPARPGGDMVWLPLMGRLGSVSATIPAMVLNILPLRVEPATGTLADCLTRIAEDLKALRRHGRCRIEQIAQDCGLTQNERFFFSPLINVMPFDPVAFDGCDTDRDVLAAGPGDGFNITISATPRLDQFIMYLEADPTRTPPDLFRRHCHGLPRFLALALNAPPDSSAADLARSAWAD